MVVILKRRTEYISQEYRREKDYHVGGISFDLHFALLKYIFVYRERSNTSRALAESFLSLLLFKGSPGAIRIPI